MVIVLLFNKKPKDLTKSMYDSICEKEKYTFSMEEVDSEIKYSLTISKNSQNFCIDSISNEERTSTLVIDGNAFYVLHPQKEYYQYDSSEIDADILRSDLEAVKDQNYESGYETINNNKYYYEQFEGIATFAMLSDYNEESKIITRFYYDKDKIVYIKTIIDDQEEEILKVDFSDSVDESIFEIPR